MLSGVEMYGQVSHDISVGEYTVNQPLREVADKLIREQADVYAFCTYIWNARYLQALIPLIRRAVPSCKVVVGGPEVSFRPHDAAKALNADFVLIGEGEESFPKLLDTIAEQGCFENVPGCRFERDGEAVVTAVKALQNLPPNPYTDAYFQALGGRIAYLEGSRGCPFSCAFCLSGREDALRLFPLERVKADILLLANAGVRTVKFVDRTFNCHKQRCLDIIQFILSEYGKHIPTDVCFHFEIAADLFDEETLAVLETAPKGLFQMEAGLQSFHPETLAAVTRKTDLSRLCANIRRLIAMGNIHIHIDLIAGLPLEDIGTFQRSFNQAYALAPHMLQLGFLKLLYGSSLRQSVAENGYVYSSMPPYEVTASRWMSVEDFGLLHRVEDVLERLYNSGRFSETLCYVLRVSGLSPFELFRGMAVFLLERGIDTAGITLDMYTEHAQMYFLGLNGVCADVLHDYMVCDSLSSKRLNRLPLCLYTPDRRVAKIARQLSDASDKTGIKRGIAVLRAKKDMVAVVEYTHSDPVTGRYPIRMLPLSDFDV